MSGVKQVEFQKATPCSFLSFNLLGINLVVISRNEKILKNKGHQGHQAHQGQLVGQEPRAPDTILLLFSRVDFYSCCKARVLS